jgi:alkylation response protein AidB-like acyl-CoA dehydrogenase
MTAGSAELAQTYIPKLLSGTAYGALAITEPNAGSDAATLQSVAAPLTGGYSLSGSKTFITTGDKADVIVCFATVDRTRGRDGVTAFVLNGSWTGLERGKPLSKMGMHGSSTAELFFDGVPIPADHRLGEEGGGWRIVMNSVIKSRISAAAQGVGLARAAYGRTLRALTRLHGVKLPDEAAFALATLRGQILQGRLLLLAVAREVDRSNTPNAGQIGIMKQTCTDLGWQVAREAMRILGPYGDLADLGVERCLRDAKVTQIYDGTNEIQRLLIARDTARDVSAWRRQPQKSDNTEGKTTT